MFGQMLENNGLKIMFDERMKIIEDRTMPDAECHIKRGDKGVSPNDKSHALVKMLEHQKQAMHPWNLRSLRRRIQGGEPWPIPSQPTVDWWDGQKLSEL
jgi:hypothetical protein